MTAVSVVWKLSPKALDTPYLNIIYRWNIPPLLDQKWSGVCDVSGRRPAAVGWDEGSARPRPRRCASLTGTAARPRLVFNRTRIARVTFAAGEDKSDATKAAALPSLA
jgi:hypothetical protein